jgi:ribosomal protein S27E
VNQDSMRNWQTSFAEASRWLFPLAVIWLLGFIGLGWLVKVSLIFLGLLLLTPVILVLGLRWWLKRNLVQAKCPVCEYEFVGFNHNQFRCPSCSEALTAQHGAFVRLTPPGTIDVDAVEVPAQRLED